MTDIDLGGRAAYWLKDIMGRVYGPKPVRLTLDASNPSLDRLIFTGPAVTFTDDDFQRVTTRPLIVLVSGFFELTGGVFGDDHPVTSVPSDLPAPVEVLLGEGCEVTVAYPRLEIYTSGARVGVQ